MRILRGTGVDGLSGIPYKRKNLAGFHIVRPLLDTARVDIDNYCQFFDLNPRVDHTNFQTDYRRNKIRLDLIPKIQEEYNPNIGDALVRISKSARDDKDYLRKITLNTLEKNGEVQGEFKISFKKSYLTSLEPSIRGRLIVEAFKKIGLTSDIISAHISSAEALITAGETGKFVEFPRGYIIRRVYENILFCKSNLGNEILADEQMIDLNEIERGGKLELALEGGWIKISCSKNLSEEGEKAREASKDLNAILLDLDRLLEDKKNQLVFRYKKDGDYIHLENTGGRKKINRFFIDEKIDKEKRGRILLLAHSEEILWIVGHRKSTNYSWNGNTKNTLVVEYIYEM